VLAETAQNENMITKEQVTHGRLFIESSKDYPNNPSNVWMCISTSNTDITKWSGE